VITLFTLENCPRCNEIKELLEKEKREFTIKRMDDAEARTEMLIEGCYEVVAPVVKIDGAYFTYEEFMNKEEKT